MAIYYKEIPAGLRSSKPYKLYKTWVFDTSSFSSVVSSGPISVFNAIYGTGSQQNLTEFNTGFNIIVDTDNYPINVNYKLENNTWYVPYSESVAPYNFPNGNVIRYNGTETKYVDGIYQSPVSGTYEIVGNTGRNIWYSIYHLFYRKGENAQGVDLPPAIYYDEFDSKNSLYTSSAIVFSIPQNKYGESILKDSFEMIFASTSSVSLPHSSSGNTGTIVDITDDSYGNLFDTRNTYYTASIGNISYDKGLVILTNQEYYRYFSSSMFLLENTSSLSIDFSYTSYYTINQHTYACVVKSHEFNRTNNVTAYQEVHGEDTYIFDSLVDANNKPVDFKPLITSIGLFDDTDQLVAIAKFAKPVRMENNMDSIFVVKFDM